ncbi:hypothetical protein RDWZM_008958 [Blomia tropicalis]|uniref:Rap-GAP domain-containing protein n=1 Tax=Blomia tropicalis TaxID=40697 RepID=A0A9Q0M282_BLOTA|nr:hypothetical protein RDWZM_008958 [Blomia tropicalis]
MFKSKPQLEYKKLFGKFTDHKKDCFSRLRYLKDLIGTKDLTNEKQFFYNYRSIIFTIITDAFIHLDAAKHRTSAKSFSSISDYISADGINSSQREDLDLMLYALEKCLLLLPEVFEQRWQLNTMLCMLRKMLHYSNVIRIRNEGTRLFLIYFQIIGERVVRECPQIEVLYASLIPGVVTDLVGILSPRNSAAVNGPITVQHLAENPDLSGNLPPLPGSMGPVQPFPNEPFMPQLDLSHNSHLVQAGGSLISNNANAYQPQYEFKSEIQRHFLEILLDCSIRDCGKITWPDYRDRRSARAFEFLMSNFARFYLPYIFPKMAIPLNPDRPSNVSKQWPVYTIQPIISAYHTISYEHVRILQLRRYADHLKQHFVYTPSRDNIVLSPQLHLQTIVIQWFTKYLMDYERLPDQSGTLSMNGNSTLTPEVTSNSFSRTMQQYSTNQISNQHSGLSANNSHAPNVPYPTQSFQKLQFIPQSEQIEREFIRSLLNSKRLYVDLILSLFHETLLLPFKVETQDPNRTPIRNVIKVYRQWIHKETVSPLPLFLNDPPASSPSTNVSRYPAQLEDSVCCGVMNFLNVFILSSANVFLLEVPPTETSTLDLQVDICKRVFNIYRYMVMKVDMERTVWENLVQVLIQVTRAIVSPEVPLKREDSLGGRLAPALFQTLVVTWIKANLNVAISSQFWEAFHQLVSSLTQWEELVNEWSNTMHILNRVMSRYVFNINLNELPLDKVGNDKKRLMKAAAASGAGAVKSITSPNHDSFMKMNMGNNKETSNVSSQEHMQGRNSITSNTSIQRQTSNDGQPQPPPRHRRGLSAAQSSSIFTSQSIVAHGQIHMNIPLLKMNRHRSLSDSCLFLSLQKSLCPMRVERGSMGGSHLQRVFGHRSKRASQKSTFRHSSRFPNCGMSQTGNSRNLPMIDDDNCDEEIVENCTIVDSDMHGHNELDFSDTSSNVDSAMDGFFPDCFSTHSAQTSTTATNIGDLNHFLFNHGYKSRPLFRSFSADDIGTTMLNSNGRHWSIWSEAISIGGGTTLTDANSLKEQPMGFDGSVSASSTCSSSVAETMSITGIPQNQLNTTTKSNNDSRPVLLGGTHKGWNAEISVVLWRRMLGILGDLNDISDPTIHKLAFECLVKITDDFIKMKDNISFLLNNSSGTSENTLQPSLHYFTPWLFRATTLPNEYKAGKLLAYKLLCIIALHRCELSSGVGTFSSEIQNRDFLILFYLAIKRAFITYDMELTCIIIKYCGQKFFSSALFGSSCLLFDYISAANMIVSSQETKWPRAEALHLLGSLIGFFEVYSSVLILKNSTAAPSLETYKDLKEHVLEILIIASKREQTGLGRSIALCSLGIFLYKAFQNRTEHQRLKEIVNILIAGTRVSIKRPKASPTSQFTSTSPSSPSPNNVDNTSKFNNRVLSRVACDQLRLQTDHATYLVDNLPDIARRIIEGLCHTLSQHIEVVLRENVFNGFKNLLISIQFTLAKWCMSVPKDFLTTTIVSTDYPNFVESEMRTKRMDESANIANEPKPPVTLLELVVSVFSTIANLNILEISQRRIDPRQMEALNGAHSFSDIDVIDYTVLPQADRSSWRSDFADNSNQLMSSPMKHFNGLTQIGLVDSRTADANTVKRAAQLILLHFLNFMGHFPAPKLRTTSVCAFINEADDNSYVSTQTDKLELETLNSPNVLSFIVDETSIISMIELSSDCTDSEILSRLASSINSTSSSLSKLNMQKQRPIRVIVRNLLGKFSWKFTALQFPLLAEVNTKAFNAKRQEPIVRSIATSNGHYHHHLNRLPSNDHLERSNHQQSIINDDDSDDDEKNDSFKQSLRKDELEKLMIDLFEQAPECRPSSPENGNFLHALNTTPEAVDIVALLTNQHYQERQFYEDQRYKNKPKAESISSVRISSNMTSPSDGSISSSSDSRTLTDPSFAFQQCRQLIEQTGFLTFEKRSSIDLLSKSSAMLRELRHLDGQRCRETHKIAVVYVAHGQETKEAILQNKIGSRAFEEFVSRLGWEVNLASHVGFMGGLESNLSTGLTAPYFADSFNEVIFHVSTRLEPIIDATSETLQHQQQQQPQTSSGTKSSEYLQHMNKKMRHLGNDEVHIVWSEHYKEYRRNILATQFCDALIVIYPLPAHTYSNLYRIQVSRKQEVPFFGPLFNGVVVHRDELAPLVRATAINASRAKRFNMPEFKHYFEERFDSIQSLGSKHRHRTSFEEFTTRVYAPRYDLLQMDKDSTFVNSDFDTNHVTSQNVSVKEVKIEQFLSSTSSLLYPWTLTPSNADSLSIASTNVTSISENQHQIQATKQTTPPSPPFFESQTQKSCNQFQYSQSPRAAPNATIGGTSRPTSRSSFK